VLTEVLAEEEEGALNPNCDLTTVNCYCLNVTLSRTYPKDKLSPTISKHIRSSMTTDNDYLSHSPGAMNTGASTTVELGKATFSASQYIGADLKSQFEKAQEFWSAIQQASSGLTGPESLLSADIDTSIRSTAQLIQAAEQLKLRASNYYERPITLRSIFTRRLNEEESAGVGDDEK
jgi:hypothetical protein